MRWLRISGLSGAIAAVAAIVIVAPLVADLVRGEYRTFAERPRPLIASDTEFRAIVSAAVEEMNFEGVPAPTPKQGGVARETRQRTLIVSDHSICTAADTPGRRCDDALSDSLLSEGFDSLAPRKLRSELIVANVASIPLRLEGVPRTKLVSAEAIAVILSHDDWWTAFYKVYPGTAGFAQVSVPVLTSDRQRALIYIAHYCDGLCGSGTVLLLERSQQGWRVTNQAMVWIS